jgi:hypothetical protein
MKSFFYADKDVLTMGNFGPWQCTMSVPMSRARSILGADCVQILSGLADEGIFLIRNQHTVEFLLPIHMIGIADHFEQHNNYGSMALEVPETIHVI